MLEAAVDSTPSVDRLAAFRELKSSLTARAAAGVAAAEELFASGLAELDRLVGGGLPRGGIVTLEGPVGSGRTTIAARLLARATAQGLAAVVDDGALFPPSLTRAGVCLDRLLVVPARGALGVARVVDILLRSRAFGVVLMPTLALRAQVWSRLAGLAQKAGAILVVLGVRACAELAAFAVTRIGCVLDRVLIAGASGVFARIAGYDVRAQLLKARRAAAGASTRIRMLERDDDTPVRERVIERARVRTAAGTVG